MKRMMKRILTGLFAIVCCVSASVAVGKLPTAVNETTAQAETTYTTKDIAMMGRVAGWHGNGNFEIRFTLGASDWSGSSVQKNYAGTGDLPGALKSMDFFNRIKLGDKTLAEWGCTTCYDNWYKLNSGEPDYTLIIPLAMSGENAAAATAAGISADYPVTILEGALIPSDAYLQGDTTATVYRAGCDYVTMTTDLAYGIKGVGKTEVESVKYVQGHDGNCGYFGVSLKGDDYLTAGETAEWNRGPYGSDEFRVPSYINKFLVNGVAGKAGEYGLFNLGSKGQGYYSFAFYSTEEETESVTIPAGTLFPSYAMNTLAEVNGNPVYIYYETQTDVTFYKQADGSYAKPMVEKETSVSSVKVQVGSSETDTFTVLALSEHDYPATLDNYGGTAISVKDFTAKTNFYSHVLIDGVALGSTNEIYLNIWGNKGAIGFRTSQGVNTKEITILAGCQFPSYAAVGNGENEAFVTTEDITFVKNAQGVFVEKSQNDAAELQAKKTAAIDEIESYKRTEEYFNEQHAERKAALSGATEKIQAAVSEGEITAAVAECKETLDKIATKSDVIKSAKESLDGYKAEEGYFKEAEAKQRAEIVENAKTTIDKADSQAAVNAAVAEAKAAIDKLMAAYEYYETKGVAMIGRLGGWYGNGNFQIKITVDGADWAGMSGEKTYDGDLAAMLNKLGFFDHIKMGGKTLAEWGCVACYDNKYDLNAGEPKSVITFHLQMSRADMDTASAAGIKADYPITIMEGAIIPSYAYLTKSGSTVYTAGVTYETVSSTKPYGIEATAKTTIDSVKYVQGFDGTCGYFGISFVGDDYLGDGAQTEINTNYDFNNSFVEQMLVNGEKGKVKYYGLFNLGANGKGYYAFQMFVAEEDIVSITIPAGTKFPTRAMTGLFTVNGNPVYIMYEVAEEITLYKTANGYGTYAEYVRPELENYKAGMFRTEEEAQRVDIIEKALEKLAGLTGKEEIDTLVKETKAAIDLLKTAGQYADEELADVKKKAVEDIENYKANGNYFEEQVAERLAAVNEGKAAIASAANEDEISAAIEAAKAAIDKVAEKAQVIAAAKAELDGYKAEEGYFREEEAAQRAEIVANAKAAIDSAATQTAVNTAVANAKAAIDKLMAAWEKYETKDVAMMGRIAGWHGNGNFEIRITLGEKDWSTENGQMSYEGELAAMLAKLDFFNHIMLGNKTLAEWGCTACYDNIYWLGNGGPQNTIMIPLSMGKANMEAATAAGIKADSPITIMKGALIPGYGYLTKTGGTVYSAGVTYETIDSTKAYGIEATAKTTVDGVKYVQGFDGTCGYFGISFVGDDYLGDGTQLDVNQNYYFDNKFVDSVLVNGEAGKVGFYGLFNLGEKGVGYYAFQIFVAEEDIVSITIPAGAKFPTRAMTTLFEINNNPVYIMYEVAETITLYKTANGFGSYAEAAIPQIENYKAGAFRADEEAQRGVIVAKAVADINAAGSDAEVDAIVAEAKAAIDKLKTAAQYADEELAVDKAKAVSLLEDYKADVVYLDEQTAIKATIIENAKAAIAAAMSVDEINAALANAQAEIDGIATKESIVNAAKADVEGYKADVEYMDAQAAEKAAIIEKATAAIDAANSQAEINATLESAKASIDELKTKAEVEEDALNAVKATANATVDGLKKAIDFDLYEEEDVVTINGLYATVKAAIANATTEEEINAAVAAFEAALAEVPTKAPVVGDSTTSEAPADSNEGTNSGAGSKGCNGSVSGLSFGIMILGAAVALLRKKED